MPVHGKKAQKSLHRTATFINADHTATALTWNVQPDETHTLTVEKHGEKPQVLHFHAAAALRTYVRNNCGTVRWAPGLRGGFGIRKMTKARGRGRRG